MAAPKDLAKATVLFAGDSGDGMQLTGGQFTQTTALSGNDLNTFRIFQQRSGHLQARYPASPVSKFTLETRRCIRLVMRWTPSSH